MQLLELTHSLIAVNFKLLAENTELLVNIVQTAFNQFSTRADGTSILHTVDPTNNCIPPNFILWGADPGVSHVKWMTGYWKNQEVVDTYVPPNVLWCDRPKLWPNFLSSSDTTELRNLCLEAAHDDLNHSHHFHDAARFIHKRGQGLVLREGFVFEQAEHMSVPEETYKDGTKCLTHTLIQRLRAVLPLGEKRKGMLLIRVTNIPQFSETIVSENCVTPPHKDHHQYGDDIFGLSLWSDSVLCFGHEKCAKSPPVVVVPDLFGGLTYFGKTLRTKYYHWVPNNRGPRISVTWRPSTDADTIC